MARISLIGCGRWGTFLGWYAANYGKAEGVDMYDIPTSPNFIELKNTTVADASKRDFENVPTTTRLL